MLTFLNTTTIGEFADSLRVLPSVDLEILIFGLGEGVLKQNYQKRSYLGKLEVFFCFHLFNLLYRFWKPYFLTYFYLALDSPSENNQITHSVVASFWLPSNDPLPGIGGGLPLNNGVFTLPYGLRGHGRIKPLSRRLIRKMTIHLQMS